MEKQNGKGQECDRWRNKAEEAVLDEKREITGREQTERATRPPVPSGGSMITSAVKQRAR